MEIFAFIMIGVVTGLGSVLMLLRFDGKWIKAISLTGGAAILIGEFVAFSKLLGITPENTATMLVSLLVSWVLSFSIILIILLQSLKKQETKYKIQTLDILLGDKKTIDNYYNSKKDEITKQIENEYNLESLKRERKEIDCLKATVEAEKKCLQNTLDNVEDILDKKHKIDIPIEFKFPIRTEFFELLPRYVQAVSEFNHHASSFTDSYINDLFTKSSRPNEHEMLKAYLQGISYYVGQYLFDWRDVRVHFRRLNQNDNTYEKYVAAYKSGDEYQDTLTPIPVGDGLISVATKTKRSIVFSANRKEAFQTESSHIWKDYITMVFEQLHIDGKPVLSLGISVKHQADHRDMLYFLSYIQIEQIVQENLLRIDEKFSIKNAAIMEAA